VYIVIEVEDGIIREVRTLLFRKKAEFIQWCISERYYDCDSNSYYPDCYASLYNMFGRHISTLPEKKC
jgi:methylaspartate ammonia-lyase